MGQSPENWTAGRGGEGVFLAHYGPAEVGLYPSSTPLESEREGGWVRMIQNSVCPTVPGIQPPLHIEDDI